MLALHRSCPFVPQLVPQINGKADGGMNTLCRCAEAMSSAGIGLCVTPVG